MIYEDGLAANFGLSLHPIVRRVEVWTSLKTKDFAEASTGAALGVLAFRRLCDTIRIGPFGDPALLAAAGIGIGLWAAAVYLWPLNLALGTTPLSAGAWASIAATGLAFSAATEFGKVVISARRRR